MAVSFSKMVEKTVGKGEIARYEQFMSPFPTMFSKDLHCSHVKNQGLFGKGLSTEKKI